MNPREMYCSYHWTKDRKAREAQIDYVLNGDWGTAICKAWDYVHGNWQYITSTGLLVAVTDDESFIATMYIPSQSQFWSVFKRASYIPSDELVKRMKRNYDKASEWDRKFSKKVA